MIQILHHEHDYPEQSKKMKDDRRREMINALQLINYSEKVKFRFIISPARP